MPFTSADMEAAWRVIAAPTGDTEWVDLVSTTNGDYFRFAVTNGFLKKWNRAAGTWDTASLPASFVIVVLNVLR
jgi:hypothetical protein